MLLKLRVVREKLRTAKKNFPSRKIFSHGAQFFKLTALEEYLGLKVIRIQ